MRVTGTERAVEVIERVRALRRGSLTITLGTGCCESTAPFLYEDYWSGPDAEVVGTVGDVAVYAPAMLRDLYPADEELVVDVVEELAESLSVETELGVRLILRSPDQAATLAACEVPATRGVLADGAAPGSRVRGELPEALQKLRIR
jgi:uncharacterized protein (DUF779 family)